jgi:ElaB/YqjD/DUF883 family membrane-anchored ribosome-binding protein
MHKNSVRVKPKTHALHAIHHVSLNGRNGHSLSGRVNAFKKTLTNMGDDLSVKTSKLLTRQFKTVKAGSAKMKRKAVRYAKAQPYKTAGIAVAALLCLRFLMRKRKSDQE